MKEQSLLFECDETYFFRGGEPFSAGENAFSPSMFPPNPGVIQGAIRTALMTAHGTDFGDYYNGRCNVCGVDAADCVVLSAVGEAGQSEEMGLDFSSPFVVRHSSGDTASPQFERMYPAPRDVLLSPGPVRTYVRLRPGSEPVHTDLGPISLPQIVRRGEPTDDGNAGIGLKPIESGWVAADGLGRYLRGDVFQEGDIVPEEEIVQKERRAGVGRDRATRGVKESLLYFIEHVRLREQYNLGVDVRGLPDAPLSSAVKLGGEGRLAFLRRVPIPALDKAGLADSIDAGPRFFGRRTFKVLLLSPSRFPSGRLLPDGFQEDEWEGFRVAHGRLKGIRCTFITMAGGRAERIGGWDMKRGRAKPRESFLPAGTVLYFATEHAAAEVVEALHDTKIGENTNIGHGHIVVGRW